MINRIAFLKVASLAGAAVLLPGELDSEALATALRSTSLAQFVDPLSVG